MKKYAIRSAVLLILTGMLWAVCSGKSIAEPAERQKILQQDWPLDMIVMLPGDSRSVEFEYDDTFLDPDSFHVALIAAVVPDYEIHQLTINITPVGDVGSEIAYFTWGAFVCFTGEVFDFFEILEPKFTYGFKHVTYIVDVNPFMYIGFLFSAAMVEYSHFEFPLNMTMTLTLSN
jgi:hypothetical protein